MVYILTALKGHETGRDISALHSDHENSRGALVIKNGGMPRKLIDKIKHIRNLPRAVVRSRIFCTKCTKAPIL